MYPKQLVEVAKCTGLKDIFFGILFASEHGRSHRQVFCLWTLSDSMFVFVQNVKKTNKLTDIIFESISSPQDIHCFAVWSRTNFKWKIKKTRSKTLFITDRIQPFWKRSHKREHFALWMQLNWSVLHKYHILFWHETKPEIFFYILLL